MRKFFVYILLLLSFSAESQLDYFTLQKDNGILIGVAEHLAPANAYGRKDPWIIYLHGIDHNKSQPISVNDTTRIMVVAQKGIPKLVASNPLPYYQKPGGGPTDYYRWNVIAPQNRTGEWDCEIVSKTIAHIRANRATTTDTSLIILVGYSLGGGGCFTCADVSGVYQYVKYIASVAPGYTRNIDFAFLAAQGINWDIFSSIGDVPAPPTGTRSDYFVTNIKAQFPIVLPVYYRLNDMSADNSPTDHDVMVQAIVEDTTDGDTYGMTNGGTWTRDETILERGLRFFGPRRKHLSIYYLFIISLVPLNRRKEVSKTIKHDCDN